jgi:hypothetical protein
VAHRQARAAAAYLDATPGLRDETRWQLQAREQLVGDHEPEFLALGVVLEARGQSVSVATGLSTASKS